MGRVQNALSVRRLMDEVWGQGRLAVVPELIADEYVGHLPMGDHYGPDGVRIDVATYRDAIPDLGVTVEHLIAVRDTVVRRFTLRGTHLRPFLDIPADGRPVVLRAVAIDRLTDGRLVESWAQIDLLPLLRHARCG